MADSIRNRLYDRAIRPLLFAMSADTAHALTSRALAALDRAPGLTRFLSSGTVDVPTQAGGVTLPSPVMVAAGLVKGHGFETEQEAVAAAGKTNILPGWRSIPILCGPVEIGSFTRYPRMGNNAPLVWRDPQTRSTQNRIGLRNPGALAAAEFLSSHPITVPYGISIATLADTEDDEQQSVYAAESIRLFLARGVRPSWFTINMSCPNTDADPQATQTAALADQICTAAIKAAGGVPVWAKIGPDLSDAQYEALMESFSRTGIRAVIATNTLTTPVPGTNLTAGLAGGRLFGQALAVVLKLFAIRERGRHSMDIVGSGGVMDGNTVRAYTDAGAAAVQVWSALVYRGPTAPILIAREFERLR